jgi:hypothetical protein
MAFNIIPIEQAAANLPAAMKQRMSQGVATNSNFSAGVREAVPTLSIKGKVFRARFDGQQYDFVDPNTRVAYPSIDVIMVNSAKTLAKTYYIKGYTEGDLNPPDCWSLDAIRPDATVVNKISASCITCPMNAFGSRVTPDGKPAKACADSKRIALMLPHHLGTPQPRVLVMRVPQGSHKNLKGYTQLLDRHGIDINACITRLSFDYSVAFPKLQFNFVAPLDLPQYDQVVALAESDMVHGMLDAPDFENAPTTPIVQMDTVTGMQPQTQVFSDEVPQYPPQQAPVQPQAQAQPDHQHGFFTGMEKPQPQAQAPVQPTVATPPAGTADNIIHLPDGKYFNTTTGLYVDAPKPAGPALDPDTFALPDGKFFNRRLNSWVTGPEVGAATVGTSFTPAQTQPQTAVGPGAAPQQAQPQAQPQAAPTRKRTPPKNKAQQQAELAQQQAAAAQQAAPQAQAEAQPQPQAQAQPQAQPQAAQPQPNGNGAGVAAAPADLEDMLQRILPAKQ